MLASCASGTGPEAPSPSPSDPCHVGQVVFCVLNPDVTQKTIQKTICVVGWTATVRPPSTYTSPLKLQQMKAEHLSGTVADYEEDHRVALELGGAPRDPKNLSPESHSTSFIKDADETSFKQAVCSGFKTLRQARIDLISKWLAPWPAYRVIPPA